MGTHLYHLPHHGDRYGNGISGRLPATQESLSSKAAAAKKTMKTTNGPLPSAGCNQATTTTSREQKVVEEERTWMEKRKKKKRVDSVFTMEQQGTHFSRKRPYSL
jgi:hypothetical protein